MTRSPARSQREDRGTTTAAMARPAAACRRRDGPGGALYVTEGAVGRISGVDPKTGDLTTFASGLPRSIVGIGGAIDVAFTGATAYVLVTLVGSDVGGRDVVGITGWTARTASPSWRTSARSP